MKNYYAVFHCYHVDGGFGDAVREADLVGTVMATEDEMKAFFEKWNRPRIYGHPYCDLWEHMIEYRKIEIKDLDSLEPYDPYWLTQPYYEEEDLCILP